MSGPGLPADHGDRNRTTAVNSYDHRAGPGLSAQGEPPGLLARRARRGVLRLDRMERSRSSRRHGAGDAPLLTREYLRHTGARHLRPGDLGLQLDTAPQI